MHVGCLRCCAQFKLMWKLKNRFPLHFIVFKQTASHIPYEANVERVFSRTGLLSDPHMDAEYLGKLTSIGVNKKAYKSTWQEIKVKYYAKFRGKSAANDDEDGESPPTPARKDGAPAPRKSPRLSAAK
jgi:hypothetical protein